MGDGISWSGYMELYVISQLFYKSKTEFLKSLNYFKNKLKAKGPKEITFLVLITKVIYMPLYQSDFKQINIWKV